MTVARDGTGPRLGVALALICIALGLTALDVTMAIVAVPSISAALGMSDSGAVWLAGGVSLVMGLVLIPAGRLGDRFGHRGVFVVGLLLFAVGSAGVGQSLDETQLIVARVVQGLGAGMVFPAGGALIQLLFTGRDRIRAFGARGAVISAASAFGGVIGGVVIWLAGEESGWRWLFGMNAPIALAVAVVAWICIPRQQRHPQRGTDGVGLVLLLVGLVAVLLPLIEGAERGWPWWMLGLLGTGVLVLVALGLWERAVAARGRTPLIPPALFVQPTFTAGLIVGFLVFAASTSFMFGLALYWQESLGRSAGELALVISPFGFGSIFGALFSSRVGQRRMRAGYSLVVIGMASAWLLILLVPGDGLRWWTLILSTLLAGLGQGVFVALIIDYVVRTVPAELAGVANGLLTMLQRLGAAVGVAIVAVVFAAGGGAAAVATSALIAATAFVMLLLMPRATDR